MAGVEPLRDGRPTNRPKRKWVLIIGLILTGLSLLIGGLCATLNHALQAAQSVSCSSNLRQLGLALQMYAGNNGHVYATSWKEVAANEELTPDVFLCPGDSTVGRAPGESAKEWSAHLDEPAGAHCAFVYAASGPTKATSKDDVLAFERIGGHQHFGVNILFGDGHVDLMSIEPSTPEGSRYNHLRADHAAGVRPLRLRP